MDLEQGRQIGMYAAARNGLPQDGWELIRNGSHLMYRLPNDVVARIGRAGTEDSAQREIAVSRWLASTQVEAVQLAPGAIQPTLVDTHPVTWWRALPPHRAATPSELAGVLRRLHALRPPEELALPEFAPLAGVKESAAGTSAVTEDQREWLLRHAEVLRRAYDLATAYLVPAVIHGDAWQSNVAVLESGPSVLLDLESFAIGPQEWDSIAIAVDYADFARLSDDDYISYVTAYGQDVRKSQVFRLLADIQEIRWTSFVLSRACDEPRASAEAAHRIACLQGLAPRPWTWNAF